MIGGADIVIPAIGDPATLGACVRIVQRRWPHAKFEDADTGDKYERHGDIPLGRVREIFAYADDKAEAAWDADNPESPPNSMLYLLLGPDSVTAVLDDPNTAEMQSILQSIRTLMHGRLLEEKYAEAA